MNDDRVTAAMGQFDEVLGNLILETTLAERQRSVDILTKAKDAAIKNADYPLGAALCDCRDAIQAPANEVQAPVAEPMTIATMIAKLSAVSNADWATIRRDLQALVQAARDKGFEEGEAKQAILEIQGRDRFFAEAKCMNCGDSLKDSRREPPPADGPMTIEKMIEEWWESLGPCCLRHKVKGELLNLVQAQARRDAEIANSSNYSGRRAIASDILKAAGLK